MLYIPQIALYTQRFNMLSTVVYKYWLLMTEMVENYCPRGEIPGGVFELFFEGGVRPEVWNPYPYLRIFLPQKNGWFDGFSEIFANRDPFLRVFLPQKWPILPIFCNFCEMGPSSKDFVTKMGPMSKDFWWKSNPFGRHIPVCLNMLVPPRGWNSTLIGLQFTEALQ